MNSTANTTPWHMNAFVQQVTCDRNFSNIWVTLLMVEMTESSCMSSVPVQSGSHCQHATTHTITEVHCHRFMRIVNQLGKFKPQITEHSQTLRELLAKNRIWTWKPSQAKAFQHIKELLTQLHVLAWYDPNAETKVSTNASAYSISAVLLQTNHDQLWKPVAYATRSLTDTAWPSPGPHSDPTMLMSNQLSPGNIMVLPPATTFQLLLKA